jgi:hypothetical protein
MKSTNMAIIMVIIIMIVAIITVVIPQYPIKEDIVNYSVHDKFCVNDSFVTANGCYIEDNTRAFNNYYRVDNGMYEYMQIGKNYSCSIPRITIETITDINPHHRLQSMCKEM